MHPVHSWKCSQITEGLMPAAAASTIFAAAVALRPTAAAAIVTTLTKLRRSRPPGSVTGLSKDRRSFMLVASLLGSGRGRSGSRCRCDRAHRGPRWGAKIAAADEPGKCTR